MAWVAGAKDCAFRPGLAPAAATTTKCSATQRRQFDTTGTNTTVFINLCVQKSGGRAYMEGQWYDIAYTGKSFDEFKVKVRLEYKDIAFRTRTCDWTSSFNAHRGGAGYGHCSTSWAGGGGYTSDGIAVVNTDLDGDGDWTWNLHGSPSL